MSRFRKQRRLLIFFITITLFLGWKVLVEDVEFLTGRDLAKFWVLGWCAAPGIIAPLTIWWVTLVVIRDTELTEAPWPVISLMSTAALAILIFVILASVAIAKQVQYDFIGVRYLQIWFTV